MQIGDMVRRKSDMDSKFINTSPIGVYLSEAECKEWGIVFELDNRWGFAESHKLEESQKPFLLVVHWSHTGVTWEDPEDLECWFKGWE